MRVLITCLATLVGCVAGGPSDGPAELGSLDATKADGLTGVAMWIDAYDSARAVGESNGPFAARFESGDPAAVVWLRLVYADGTESSDTSSAPRVEGALAGEFTLELRNLGGTPVEGWLEVTPLAAPTPAPTLPAPATLEDFRRHACLSCHTFDRRLVGPAFRDVAARYRGVDGALDRLATKVITGGSGVWGQIPMPPNSVSRAEAEALVTYILAQP